MEGLYPVIGIDPSYQRTGLSIYYGPDNYQLFSITRNMNKQNITICARHAYQIVKEIRQILIDNDVDTNSCLFGVEYPVLATVPGAYLGFITSKLDSMFRGRKAQNVIFLPSMAVKCYTLTRTKTDLVDWVKKSDYVEKFKGNHDEATAIVLGKIAQDCINGTYKKSFFKVNYLKEKLNS